MVRSPKGENLSLFFCPLLLSQELFFDLSKPSLRSFETPLVATSLASTSEDLIPSAFLALLFPSLFVASLNPTTLFRCLRIPRDLSRRVRVASLRGSGLGSISFFIVVLTEVSEFSSEVFITCLPLSFSKERFEDFIICLHKGRTDHRVRISRSGSMIFKWRILRSSGGKHGSCYKCRNKIGQGLAHRPVIVGVSRDLRGDSWVMYHDLYVGGKTLIEMENVGLTFAQVSSKAHREGVGLRVADSHTGNHPEGGFTPFETIRRSDELRFEVFFGGCFFIYPLDYVGDHILDLRLPKSKRLSYKEMNNLLLDKTKDDIWKWFYCKHKCSLEEGLTLVENDRDMDKMFQLANLHGTLDLYIGQIPQVFLVDYYFKNLCCVDSDEEVTSMYRSHEKTKKDVSTIPLEELIAWEQEETQSPSYLRSPHVWKKTSASTSKGKVLLDDFEDVANGKGKVLLDDFEDVANGKVENDRDCEKMFELANFHGYLDVYVGHNPQVILLDWYFKKLEVVCESDEEVTSKYRSHEKARKDSSTMSLEELIAWDKGKVVLDDFEDVANGKGKVVLDDFADVGNGKGKVVLDESKHRLV
ncbi:hypothetical protein Tco_0221843 [Tanacetum coccineum]